MPSGRIRRRQTVVAGALAVFSLLFHLDDLQRDWPLRYLSHSFLLENFFHKRSVRYLIPKNCRGAFELQNGRDQSRPNSCVIDDQRHIQIVRFNRARFVSAEID